MKLGLPCVSVGSGGGGGGTVLLEDVEDDGEGVDGEEVEGCDAGAGGSKNIKGVLPSTSSA